MKKLRNKTFIILVTILTIFLSTLLVIFNSVLYNNHYNLAQDKLMRISKMPDRVNPFGDGASAPMFIDSEIYIISFDNRYNIKQVRNFSGDGKSENEIVRIVSKDYNSNKNNKIGNLYTNKYIYFLNNNRELFVINNSSSNVVLFGSLYLSVVIFVVIEIAIIYVSILLTKWLIKPVNETFEKQKQFICDASHELKTPLSVIMASVETLEKEPTSDKWLNVIKMESERMNKLVVDLLELTRTEELKVDEISEDVNLSKIILQTTLMFESLAFENGLDIETDIEDNIKFKCHGDRIKQLLGILLDNGIKHGLKNSKLKVNLKKEKDEIILKVSNRGNPIPDEEKSLIFDRFYRTDKSRNRNDNRYGLGLAIAKNIVVNHNGVIYVECKNGYTSFIVRFK